MNNLSTPLRALAGALLATAVLAGCATNPTGAPVSRNEVQRAQTVEFGVVTNVRPVSIQPNSTVVGTTTGAVVGGSVGSNLCYRQNFEYMFVLSKGRPKAVNLIRDHMNLSALASYLP